MAKTFLELMEMAAEVRDETAQGENTALRVGGLLAELVEYLRGCTLAEDVSVAAESGRVLLRFARHDAEGTAFFQDVVIGAADAEKAGVMTAEKVALVEGHSAEIASVSSDVAALENKVTLQGKLINGHTTALSSVNALLKTHEANILAAQELAQTAQSAAEKAQTAAEKAQTAADEAATKAEKAQTTADAAQELAQKAQTAADNAQTAADEAATKAEKAQTTADAAQTAATTAQTNANAATSGLLKLRTTVNSVQTTAENAQSTADTNKAEIAYLQSYTTELGEDRDNLLATTAGLCNIGNYSSSDDAYAKLATAEIAGDEDKRVIFFTVGTAYNGVVLQTVENDYCKQFIVFATHYYLRAIYFTDGERTATSYVEPLRYAFGDRLAWNADQHKLLLSQFGAAFNDDCTDAIPTATNERDGLMTKELVKRIETLENKVAAYHPL